MTHLTAAQLRQQSNRDQAGRYSHGTLTTGIPDTSAFPSTFADGSGQPVELFAEVGHVTDAYNQGQIDLDTAISETRRITGMNTMGSYNWLALSDDNDLSVYPAYDYSTRDDIGALTPIRTFTADYGHGTCTFHVHHFENGVDGPGSPTWVIDANIPANPHWDNSTQEVNDLWEGHRPPSPSELKDALDVHYEYTNEAASGMWDGFDNPSYPAYSDTHADAEVLASAGFGTDEDYGHFGDSEY